MTNGADSSTSSRAFPNEHSHQEQRATTTKPESRTSIATCNSSGGDYSSDGERKRRQSSTTSTNDEGDDRQQHNARAPSTTCCESSSPPATTLAAKTTAAADVASAPASTPTPTTASEVEASPSSELLLVASSELSNSASTASSTLSQYTEEQLLLRRKQQHAAGCGGKLQFDGPLSLYGRQDEIRLLNKTLDRVIAQINNKTGKKKKSMSKADQHSHDDDDHQHHQDGALSSVSFDVISGDIKSGGGGGASKSLDDDDCNDSQPQSTPPQGQAQLQEQQPPQTKRTTTRIHHHSNHNSGNKNTTSKHFSNRELVLIKGASGTGKSTLAMHLKSQVQTHNKNHGFFISGKFDQHHTTKPYSAMITACRELIQQLVELGGEYSKNEGNNHVNDIVVEGGEENHHHDNDTAAPAKSFEYIQRRVLSELGNESSVLTQAIPCLKELLEDYGTSTGDGGGRQRDSDSQPPDVQAATTAATDAECSGGVQTSTPPATTTGAATSMGLIEARNQFNYAFRRLMRILSTLLSAPIVLVLDDLQWADSASLDLVENLLRDVENPSLLVIGAYRSNEVTDESHILNKTIRELTNRSTADGINIQHIEIGDLEVSDICQLLADLLSTHHDGDEKAAIQKLATTLHIKTHGNVFFMKHYLLSLQQQRLLQFNAGLMKWTWDLDEIEQSTSATENVFDLMHEKLKVIPMHYRRMLPLAACLGVTFDESVLAFLVASFADQQNYLDRYFSFQTPETMDAPKAGKVKKHYPSASDLLQVWQEEGLIYQHQTSNTRRPHFRWVHDRVQEAAIGMVTAKKLAAFRFHVGTILYKFGKEGEVDIFVILNLLNDGANNGLIGANDPMKIKLIELNLKAGRTALEAFAYEPAIHYLKQGISQLPDNHFDTHYELSLELYTCAAEAEYVISDTEQLAYHCQQVLSQTKKPLIDKFRAYYVLIESLGNGGSLHEAIGLCLGLLGQLGCHFPKRAVSLKTVGKIISLKSTLKKLSADVISNMPEISDPVKLMEMKLLDVLGRLTYLASHELAGLVLFKRLTRTLKYGFCDYTASALAGVCFIVTWFVGDFKEGKRISDFCLKFKSRGSKAYEACSTYALQMGTMHHLVPMSLQLQPLVDGYQQGLETGDLNGAMWCIYTYLHTALDMGKNLRALETDMRTFYKQMKDHHYNETGTYLKCSWQRVLNLLGAPYSTNTTLLSGEVMDRDEMLNRAEMLNKPLLRATVLQNELILKFHYGNNIEAADMAISVADEACNAAAGVRNSITTYCYSALACFSAYRTTKQRKYLKFAKTVSNKIKTWARKGNPNLAHYIPLLDAELTAAAGKNNLPAGKLFRDAITTVGRLGMPHEHAIANERYGEFLFIVMHDREEAAYRLEAAVELYSEWGASGKVDRMGEQYPDLWALPMEINLRGGGEESRDMSSLHLKGKMILIKQEDDISEPDVDM